MPLSDYAPTDVTISQLTTSGHIADDKFAVTITAPLITDPLIIRLYTITGVFLMPTTVGVEDRWSYTNASSVATSQYNYTFVCPSHSRFSLAGARVQVNIGVSITDIRTGESYDPAEAVLVSNTITGRLAPPIFPTMEDLRDPSFDWSKLSPFSSDIASRITSNPMVEDSGGDKFASGIAILNPKDRTGFISGQRGNNVAEIGIEQDLNYMGQIFYSYPSIQDDEYVEYDACVVPQKTDGTWDKNMASGSSESSIISYDPDMIYPIIGLGLNDVQLDDVYQPMRYRMACRAYAWDAVSYDTYTESGSTVNYYVIKYGNQMSEYNSDAVSRIVYGPTLTDNDEAATLSYSSLILPNGDKQITLTCTNIVQANVSYIVFYYTDAHGQQRQGSVPGGSFVYTVPSEIPSNAWATVYGNNNVRGESKETNRVNISSGDVLRPVVVSAVVVPGLGVKVNWIPPSRGTFYYALFIDGMYCEATASPYGGVDNITYTFSGNSASNFVYSGVEHYVTIVAYSITSSDQNESAPVVLGSMTSEYAVYFTLAESDVMRVEFDTRRGLGFESSNVIISNSEIKSSDKHITKDNASILREVMNTYTTANLSRSLRAVV